MNENTERIERYLQGLIPPEHESEPHRQQLRRRILGEIERRQTMSVKGRAWKIAAAVAALVCTGAVAATVSVKIHQYYFEGRGTDGAYHFSTGPEVVYQSPEGEVTVTSSSTVIGSNDPNFTIDVEQTQKDLDEMAILRQQGNRELVGVIDTKVNGRFHRTFEYQYTLSDGRTRTMAGGDGASRAPGTPEEYAEIARLRQQGVRDVVSVIDTEAEGQTSRTLICRYVLADGREMNVGEGDPAWPEPTKRLSDEQIDEVWRLKRLGQAEPRETVEATLYGKTFTFERQVVTLADGTVVTLSVGEIKGVKTSLTQADWAEFRDLRAAGQGVALDAYEEHVQGRTFLFKPQRFILSDGTEFIWAVGKPGDGQ